MSSVSEETKGTPLGTSTAGGITDWDNLSEEHCGSST